MQTSKVIIAGTLVLMVALFAVQIGIITSRQARINQVKADVYAVCNQSRLSPTITEQQCGDLQDATNSEFLCKANNMLASNRCWVEVK